MSTDSKASIVLVTYQYSIIVKGLENNLKAQGYDVSMIEDKAIEVYKYLDKADIFLVYLPVDMFESSGETTDLETVNTIKAIGTKKMILIGEKRNHELYTAKIPAIVNRPWINRPVEPDQLIATIEKVLAAKEITPGEKSILIVDDDPIYAKMIREWLGDTYKISIVTAGMQALKFLLKNKVDLILLDYEMPIVDGPQVLEMLRSDPDLADIPVVFLTGIGTRESIERVMSLKPSGYILKTTTRDKLIHYLNDLFAKM